MKRIDHLIEELRRERASNRHAEVFDVRAARRDGVLVLVGETTLPAAIDELLRRAAADSLEVRDEVVRLPDAGLGEDRHALVTAAVAPVMAEPRVESEQASQYVLGHRLDVLSRHSRWLRVRGEDGYVGWIHRGYLGVGRADWALAWERSDSGDSVVSLGAELLDDEERVMMRLPWGARVVREAPGRLRLPDGRQGTIGSGEIVDADRLTDRFPPRGESVARTGRRWLGAPYLWGGVTLGGVDCSGFVQSVFWMHGVALPRDAAAQASVGETVDGGADLDAFRPGDLLFFAESGDRVTHVALSLGGTQILHAAISSGGVSIDDLAGDRELEKHLRKSYVHARRLLPD